MDNGFARAQRRHTRELNIVPILDMMTTVIFFLLLSTSFIEFTKITVPPSTTQTITDPVVPPPAAPRMVVMYKEAKKGFRIQLTWTGEKPGEKHETYVMKNPVDVDGDAQELLKLSQKVIAEFHKDYPQEKTIQLGLGSKVPYSHLVAVMDGVQAGFDQAAAAANPPAANGAAPGQPPPATPPAATNPDGTPAAVTDLANIVLVSHREVDAETARTGEDL